MDLGGYTARGPREANEDSFFTYDLSGIDSFSNGVEAFVMVSDGMGGYQGGDVASGMAVSSAENYLRNLLDMAEGNRIDLDVPSALAEIVQNAHEAILAETRIRGNASMGATFVGAFISPNHAWIGHVGDSRAYLLRAGQAIQITEDHSQVGRMLSRGLITEEEAQNHPARNRIERALGFTDADPEIDEVDLLPGDGLLMCSDGVYTVLGADVLVAHALGKGDANAAARRVVKAALSSGTDDNSTAVVVLGIPGYGEGYAMAPAAVGAGMGAGMGAGVAGMGANAGLASLTQAVDAASAADAPTRRVHPTLRMEKSPIADMPAPGAHEPAASVPDGYAPGMPTAENPLPNASASSAPTQGMAVPNMPTPDSQATVQFAQPPAGGARSRRPGAGRPGKHGPAAGGRGRGRGPRAQDSRAQSSRADLGESKSSPTSSMRSKRLLVPIVLAIVLIVVFVGLAVFTAGPRGQVAESSAAASPAASAAASPTTSAAASSAESAGGLFGTSVGASSGAAGAAGATGAGADAGSAAASESFVECKLAENADLIYVDADGTAQNFDHGPMAMESTVQLLAGSSITASKETDSFGYDREYRVLSDDYLAALKTDCENAREGALTLTSKLALIADKEEYAHFVEVLAGKKAEHSITKLIIREETVESTSGAVGAGAAGVATAAGVAGAVDNGGESADADDNGGNA